MGSFYAPRFIFQSKPPDAKKLETARKLRLKQCEMKAIIKEIITHFVVVCIVFIVAYGNHDNGSFRMTDEINKALVVGDSEGTTFNDVSSIVPLLTLSGFHMASSNVCVGSRLRGNLSKINYRFQRDYRRFHMIIGKPITKYNNSDKSQQEQTAR